MGLAREIGTTFPNVLRMPELRRFPGGDGVMRAGTSLLYQSGGFGLHIILLPSTIIGEQALDRPGARP